MALVVVHGLEPPRPAPCALEPPSEGAGATHACKNLFKQGDKEGETDAEGVIDPDAPLHGWRGWPGW
jgi:hypothetical protein